MQRKIVVYCTVVRCDNMYAASSELQKSINHVLKTYDCVNAVYRGVEKCDDQETHMALYDERGERAINYHLFFEVDIVSDEVLRKHLEEGVQDAQVD